MALYALDPWGDQRADLRMAQIVWAALQPHSRSRIEASSFRLFPDEMHDVPENADAQEREWMIRLNRLAGE